MRTRQRRATLSSRPRRTTAQAQATASDKSSSDGKKDDGGKCPVPLPGIAGKACDAASGAAKGAVDTVTGAPGKVAGAVAGSVLDQMTKLDDRCRDVDDEADRAGDPEDDDPGAGRGLVSRAVRLDGGARARVVVVGRDAGAGVGGDSPRPGGAGRDVRRHVPRRAGDRAGVGADGDGAGRGGRGHQRGGGRRGGPERVEVLGRRRWRLGEGTTSPGSARRRSRSCSRSFR